MFSKDCCTVLGAEVLKGGPCQPFLLFPLFKKQIYLWERRTDHKKRQVAMVKDLGNFSSLDSFQFQAQLNLWYGCGSNQTKFNKF